MLSVDTLTLIPTVLRACGVSACNVAAGGEVENLMQIQLGNRFKFIHTITASQQG